MSIATLLSRGQTEAPPQSPAEPTLPALGAVRMPRLARRLARWLAFILIILPFLLLLVPWQQSLSGTGRVIAYDPQQRRQTVEAPVDGRVKKWHKREGDPVRGPILDSRGNVLEVLGVRLQGDLLVTLEDPDPQLTSRLAEERAAVEREIEASQARVQTLDRQIEQLLQSQKQALEVADRRIEIAERNQQSAIEAERAAEATLKLAKFTFEMEDGLFKKGLTSGRDFELARQGLERAQAALNQARQSNQAAAIEVQARKVDRQKILSDTSAALESARASRQDAETRLETARAKLQPILVRQRRQEAQEVHAPCDGTLQQVMANSSSGGMLVKVGDPLCVVVPNVQKKQERVVELLVGGNDAPLITELWAALKAEGVSNPRVPVRVQFQGWPAIQFVGWPSVSYGTFGGLIVFVDPHDDGEGNFRVLVQPDPEEEKVNPWPPDYSLRQGNRVKGWVLLRQVTLGWELWRRLNGFPPTVSKKKPGDIPAKK